MKDQREELGLRNATQQPYCDLYLRNGGLILIIKDICPLARGDYYVDPLIGLNLRTVG